MMPQQGFLNTRGNATDDDYEDDVVTVDNVAIKHDKNKRGQQLQNQHQNQQHDYDIKCYSFFASQQIYFGNYLYKSRTTYNTTKIK